VRSAADPVRLPGRGEKRAGDSTSIIDIIAEFRMLNPVLIKLADTRVPARPLGWKIFLIKGTGFDIFRNIRRKPLPSLRQKAYELERLNLELTGRLAEMTAMRDETERANKAKTRFLASASHDLRQPMHAISLLVGILRERVVDAEEQLLVGKIETSVQAMENLFGSLLDISKLDAGAVKPSVSSFPIENVLHLIELNYTPLAQEKGIALKVMRSGVKVRSDAQVLERILGNLVANAIRYTSKGRVLVGCRRRGEALQVLVFDTGVGIPAAHLGDIFDEFFQLANPERDRSKGLGLGLSIVKRSAELLGHPPIVRSQPGRGSVFGIEVPIVSTAPNTAPQAMQSRDNVGSLIGAFVVLIEDDQENRYAMDALFRQWGCHVVSAGSVSDAADKLIPHLRAPDLIVSDCRLREGQTGLMAVKKIRIQADRHIPAILVTGDIHAADIAGAAAVGARVLHKPVNSGKLRGLAEEMLAASTDADLLKQLYRAQQS
jgi:signal transduction histidine kinase/CheY-like chemotaxis protein